jgi:hypothetical protein
MCDENFDRPHVGPYFTEIAAAFVRGKIGTVSGLSSEELILLGRERGLRLHKFKKQIELPRVRRVLGILRNLAPGSLVDIGSGRGTFLWPLLDAFPFLEVTAIDIHPVRVADIDAVRRGGMSNLRVLLTDAADVGLTDKCVDVVTALEVLEHVPDPRHAAGEAVRIARNFVLASVPSRGDDNPEHVRLFDRESFERLWLDAGALSVKMDYVPNHIVAVVIV